MNRLLCALILCLTLPLRVQADDPLPFRIVYFDNYAPYSWADADGRMRGVFVDILDAVIGERLGLPVMHTGLPWARAQQYVKTGEYDAMIAPVTAERRHYANVSQHPVLDSRMTLFTRADHPSMEKLQATRSLEDIRAFDFVTQLGDGWARENLRDMQVQYVGNLDTVLRMLSLGRADLFVEASLVTHWNLKNLGLADAVSEVDNVTIEITPFHLMISKKSPRQILPDIDREMRELVTSGELDRLLARYKP